MPAAVQYSDLVSNPHFQHLAALFRRPFRSYTWRRTHPNCPFWNLERDLTAARSVLPKGKEEYLSRFVDMLLSLVTADPSLHYSTADMDWLIATLDRPDSATCMALLAACYSAPVSRDDAEPDAALSDSENTSQLSCEQRREA